MLLAPLRTGRLPVHRPVCGEAPGQEPPAARIGKPACDRRPRRPILKCPRVLRATAQRRSVLAAQRDRPDAIRCPAVRPAPGLASGTQTSSRPRSAVRRAHRWRKTGAPGRPSGAPAGRPWQSPAGWSNVTPTRAGRRSRRQAAARQRGSRCAANAVWGGTGMRSRPARPALGRSSPAPADAASPRPCRKPRRC